MLLMEKLPYVGVGFVNGDLSRGETQPRQIDACDGFFVLRRIALARVRFDDVVRSARDRPVVVHAALVSDKERTRHANEALEIVELLGGEESRLPRALIEFLTGRCG